MFGDRAVPMPPGGSLQCTPKAPSWILSGRLATGKDRGVDKLGKGVQGRLRHINDGANAP